jgi:hypothetical protein
MTEPETGISYVIGPEQCRAARAWLGWTQEELSRRSSVGLSTIKDFEKTPREPHNRGLEEAESSSWIPSRHHRTLLSIRRQLQHTFEQAGLEFFENTIRMRPA